MSSTNQSDTNNTQDGRAIPQEEIPGFSELLRVKWMSNWMMECNKKIPAKESVKKLHVVDQFSVNRNLTGEKKV